MHRKAYRGFDSRRLHQIEKGCHPAALFNLTAVVGMSTGSGSTSDVQWTSLDAMPPGMAGPSAKRGPRDRRQARPSNPAAWHGTLVSTNGASGEPGGIHLAHINQFDQDTQSASSLSR